MSFLLSSVLFLFMFCGRFLFGNSLRVLLGGNFSRFDEKWCRESFNSCCRVTERERKRASFYICKIWYISKICKNIHVQYSVRRTRFDKVMWVSGYGQTKSIWRQQWVWQCYWGMNVPNKKTKYLLMLTPRGGRRFASGSSSSSCCVVGRMGENLINFGRILMLIPSK